MMVFLIISFLAFDQMLIFSRDSSLISNTLMNKISLAAFSDAAPLCWNIPYKLDKVNLDCSNENVIIDFLQIGFINAVDKVN